MLRILRVGRCGEGKWGRGWNSTSWKGAWLADGTLHMHSPHTAKFCCMRVSSLDPTGSNFHTRTATMLFSTNPTATLRPLKNFLCACGKTEQDHSKYQLLHMFGAGLELGGRIWRVFIAAPDIWSDGWNASTEFSTWLARKPLVGVTSLSKKRRGICHIETIITIDQPKLEWDEWCIFKGVLSQKETRGISLSIRNNFVQFCRTEACLSPCI